MLEHPHFYYNILIWSDELKMYNKIKNVKKYFVDVYHLWFLQFNLILKSSIPTFNIPSNTMKWNKVI